MLRTTLHSCRTLDTLHTILISHVVYIHLVTNFFNPESLFLPSWFVRSLKNISVEGSERSG